MRRDGAQPTRFCLNVSEPEGVAVVTMVTACLPPLRAPCSVHFVNEKKKNKSRRFPLDVSFMLPFQTH